MDLMIDGYKYIFWFSNWHATDGKVSGSVGYAFSGTDK